METFCRRALSNGWHNGRGTYTRRFTVDITRYNRTISTTTRLQAAKKSKGPSNPRTSTNPAKPQRQSKQPLDYQPSIKAPPRTRIIPEREPSNPSTQYNPLKYRTIPIVLGSITLFALSSYLAYIYVTISRSPSSTTPPSRTPSSQRDVSHRYNDIARSFDASVEWNEKVMGLNKMRKKLAGMARGDVLEVSIGTGRNLAGYEFEYESKKGGKVKSFTAIDKSAEMLEVAHEKFSTLYPGIIGVRWIVGDASEPGKIPPPPKNANEDSGNKEGAGAKYDTIIQTMGLCSVEDPVKLLKALGQVVKVETGRILLIEHGRGTWGWVNRLLDGSAEGHAEAYGCWWNRDLEGIVRGCGLEVVRFERRHAGTTAWIELKRGGDGK